MLKKSEASLIPNNRDKGEMKETTTTLNSRWADYTVAISGIKGFKCDSYDELVFSVEETRMIQNIAAGLADSTNPTCEI